MVVQAKYCWAYVLFSGENDELNTPVCLCNVLINWPFALKWHLVLRQFPKIPCNIEMDKGMEMRFLQYKEHISNILLQVLKLGSSLIWYFW